MQSIVHSKQFIEHDKSYTMQMVVQTIHPLTYTYHTQHTNNVAYEIMATCNMEHILYMMEVEFIAQSS